MDNKDRLISAIDVLGGTSKLAALAGVTYDVVWRSKTVGMDNISNASKERILQVIAFVERDPEEAKSMATVKHREVRDRENKVSAKRKNSASKPAQPKQPTEMQAVQTKPNTFDVERILEREINALLQIPDDDATHALDMIGDQISMLRRIIRLEKENNLLKIKLIEAYRKTMGA